MTSQSLMRAQGMKNTKKNPTILCESIRKTVCAGMCLLVCKDVCFYVFEYVCVCIFHVRLVPMSMSLYISAGAFASSFLWMYV